jgi:hypothetical protein
MIQHERTNKRRAAQERHVATRSALFFNQAKPGAALEAVLKKTANISMGYSP